MLEEQLAYWRERLAGAPAVLELPTDRTRPAVERFRGRRHHFELPEDLVGALNQLARGEESTPFMLLLGALQVLLHRYTGQGAVSVGTPIANRDLLETESVIGFFTNTLVLRTDLAGKLTFRDLLAEVRTRTIEAYEHQALPFERLVEELQPERSLHHTPLFQVMLVWQKEEPRNVDLPGLKLSALARESGSSKFDLTLFLTDVGREVRCAIEYNSDIFDATSIARLAHHFEILLRGISAAPDEAIASFGLLDRAERQQLLVEWNATAADTSRDLPLHALFERQVARRGDAVALECDGLSLTYSQLDSAADNLAARLRHLGARPDRPVAICMERSPEMFVAVLGILKAGASYLPLDLSYPAERVRYMLENSQAGLLVSRPGTPRPSHPVHVVELELEALCGSAPDEGAVPGPVFADQTAYLIYTSGSTGRPKGVALPHRALVNLVEWQRDHLGIAAGARVLQFSSLSFDVSASEAFTAWAVGGTLVMVSEEDRRDVSALARFCIEQEVETVILPFVALQQLADELRRVGRVPPTLRRVFSTAEPLQITESVRWLFERLPDAELCNQYGPSETHVVTAGAVDGAVADWPSLPSIGRPIPNARTHVVDREARAVPVGVAGELLLGGDGLARGYFDRPGLTAERFVPDPFSGVPGGRLYRSGDLATLLPDGNLRFLGRADQQVKLRGFRIEPGEVETVLKGNPAVRDAAVVMQTGAEGQKYLGAYIVPADGAEPSEVELRHFLRDYLPEYMIPAVISTVPSLPTTPSGKLDRRALVGLPVPRARTAPASRPPRTSAESVVAGIWSAALGREVLGVEESFFDLGGHSLQAMQIILRLRDEFAVEQLPLRSLFETPTVIGTVAALAAELGGTEIVEAVAEAILEIRTMAPEEMGKLLARDS